jgi:hypothetical protein
MESKKELKSCYNSLDELPLWNWHKITTTGEFRYLQHDVDAPIEDAKSIRDLWTRLHDKFQSTLGQTPQAKLVAALRKRTAQLMNAYMDGQRHLHAIIANEQAQIESLEKQMDKGDNNATFEQSIASVERYMKIPIDAKKVSVSRFYQYIELLRQESVNLKNHG